MLCTSIWHPVVLAYGAVQGSYTGTNVIPLHEQNIEKKTNFGSFWLILTPRWINHMLLIIYTCQHRQAQFYWVCFYLLCYVHQSSIQWCWRTEPYNGHTRARMWYLCTSKTLKKRLISDHFGSSWRHDGSITCYWSYILANIGKRNFIGCASIYYVMYINLASSGVGVRSRTRVIHGHECDTSARAKHWKED